MSELEAPPVKGMIAGLETVGTVAHCESAKDSQDSDLQTSTPAVLVAQATLKSNVEATAVGASEHAAPTETTEALQLQTTAAALPDAEATSQDAPRCPEKTEGPITGSETSGTADDGVPVVAAGDPELKNSDSMTAVTPEKADGSSVVDSGAADAALAAETNTSAPDDSTPAPAIATTQATAEVPRQSIFGSGNTSKAATLASAPALKTLPEQAPAPSLFEFSTPFVFTPPRIIESPFRSPTSTVGTPKVTVPIVASPLADPHPASSNPSKRVNMSAPSPDKCDISTTEFPAQTIVDDGDLKLSVGLTVSQRKVFLVASQALWAVSPVFKAMLQPTSSFKEAVALRNPGSEPPVVSLDDDFAAMEIVLNMLFHRHSRLPETDTYTHSQVFQIALITEKYELHDVMHYWSRDVYKSFEEIPQTAADDDSIFIAWVFGYDKMFSERTGRLTLRTTPHPKHRIAVRKPDLKTQGRKNVFIRPSIPDALIGKILEIRLRRIETLRELVGSHYTLIVSADAPHDLCKQTNFNANRDFCNNLISGSFLQQYKRLKLGDDIFWDASVEEIDEKLRAIPRMGHRVPGGAAHSDCGWEGSLYTALKTWQDLVAEKYVIRLADFPSRNRK